jgi:hypothetical protein
MAIPIIEIHCLETIHSPFSGLPAEDEDGPNEADPTLLFNYYGMAGEYGWISPRWSAVLPQDDEEVHPTDLAESLDIDGSFLLVVDTDWNGVNCYGFAPEESVVAKK